MTKKKLLLRRGTFANLPDLDEGEPGWITDKKILVIGDSSGSEGTFINPGSIVHPEEYGAVGDGTTDDAVAIQAAIDSLALTGGRILFTNPSYNLGTTGITVLGDGIILEGRSLRTAGDLGSGVELLYSGTAEAVTFGITGDISYNNGFNYIQVRAEGAAIASATAIGIKMINQHYLSATNFGISTFTAGTGLYLTAAGAGMYGATCHYYKPFIWSCHTGIKAVGIDASIKDNHALFYGGCIIGDVSAGSIGIDIDQYTDGYRFYGTDVESFAIGINVDGTSCNFIGSRTEFNTLAVNIAANAVRTEFHAHQWAGSNRDITDAGTSTYVFDNYGITGQFRAFPLVDGAEAFSILKADAVTYLLDVTTSGTPKIQLVNSLDLYGYSDAFITNTWRILSSTGQIATLGRLEPATAAGAMSGVALFAGTGVPDNGDGTDGDFYFRADGTKAGNTVIYHKEGVAWVALVVA